MNLNQKAKLLENLSTLDDLLKCSPSELTSETNDEFIMNSIVSMSLSNMYMIAHGDKLTLLNILLRMTKEITSQLKNDFKV